MSTTEPRRRKWVGVLVASVFFAALPAPARGGVNEVLWERVVSLPEPGLLSGTTVDLYGDECDEVLLHSGRRNDPSCVVVLDGLTGDELWRAGFPGRSCLVSAAIGILLLNAMLMAVFERIREFGVLKALGAGPLSVFRMIFYETYIQAGIAIVVGTALSVPGLWYLTEHGIDTGRMGGMTIHGVAWDSVWRAQVSTSTYSGPIVTLIVIVSLAALYPAFKAAWVRPVQAMTHR